MSYNETVADIVAEMRYGMIPKHRTDHELLAIYADRIEAAWKRERAEVEADALAVGGIVEAARHKSVCNTAAMREALVKAKKAICHHAEHICQSLSWENSNIQSNCADVLCAHSDLCEAKTAIMDALAAPQRNCDRFTSIEEARTAYCSESGRIVSIWDRSESGLFEEWLLAPAAERKGE